MIEKNKDGIGSRFLREAGIGYARTHGNSEGEAQSEKYRERSGQIHLLPASPDEGDKMCLIKNINMEKRHEIPYGRQHCYDWEGEETVGKTKIYDESPARNGET